MLALLALLLPQDFAPYPPTPFDEVIPLEFDASDDLLEGHGRCERIECVAEFSGTLHVWTSVSARDGAASGGGVGATAADAGPFDLFLRIEDAKGDLVAENDDGGGKTPYVKLEVESGRQFTVLTAVARGEAVSRAELHLIAAPETEATLAAAKDAERSIAEVKRLREASQFEDARALAVATLERLRSISGAERSWWVTVRLWWLGDETYRLSLLAPTRDALDRVLSFLSRTLPNDHPDLQIARMHLARALAGLGDLPGARAQKEEVIEAYSRTLPENHDYLQMARGNLAITIKALGDLPGARALEEKSPRGSIACAA